jgi:Arrestin (or S-antigen), N-terminal domain
VALSERQEGDTQNIQPGVYGFPFSIHLPASLPSSTRANCGKRSYCKIEVSGLTLRYVGAWRKHQSSKWECFDGRFLFA